MNRKGKVRAKQRRLNNLRSRRWERCERVLEPFGLAEGFRALSERNRQQLWERCRLPPRLVIDPSAAAFGPELQTEFQSYFSSCDVAVADAVIPLLDAFTILIPLLATLRTTLADPGHKHESYLQRARETAERHFENVEPQVLDGLANALGKFFARFSSFDEQLFWFRLAETEPPAGKSVLEITVGKTAPERVTVELDGAYRTTFRCGAIYSRLGSIDWVSWPAAIFGVNKPTEYPVYVQRHAIDRYRERVRFPHEQAQASMFLSLRRPVIVEQRGDEYLVECRALDRYRIGYFVARRLANVVVVKTFLFLTMQGTPEARQLYERLRIRRPDIEYHRLDDLCTFLLSDIADDPGLAKLFEECGCGQLLHLKEHCEGKRLEPGYAANLRRYLGNRYVRQESSDNETITFPQPPSRQLCQANGESR